MSTDNRFSLFPKRNKETWTVSRYVVIEQSYNSPSSSGFYNEMEKHLPMRRFKLLIPDSSELVSPGISPKFLGICSFDKSPSSSGTRKKKQKKKKRALDQAFPYPPIFAATNHSTPEKICFDVLVTRTSHVCKPINGFKAVPSRFVLNPILSLSLSSASFASIPEGRFMGH